MQIQPPPRSAHSYQHKKGSQSWICWHRDGRIFNGRDSGWVSPLIQLIFTFQFINSMPCFIILASLVRRVALTSGSVFISIKKKKTRFSHFRLPGSKETCRYRIRWWPKIAVKNKTSVESHRRILRSPSRSMFDQEEVLEAYSQVSLSTLLMNGQTMDLFLCINVIWYSYFIASTKEQRLDPLLFFSNVIYAYRRSGKKVRKWHSTSSLSRIRLQK